MKIPSPKPKLLPPLAPVPAAPAEIADLAEVAWEPTPIEAELLAAAGDAASAGIARSKELEARAREMLARAEHEHVAAGVRYNGAVRQLALARMVDPKRVRGHWWDSVAGCLRVKLAPEEPADSDQAGAAAALAQAFGG